MTPRASSSLRAASGPSDPGTRAGRTHASRPLFQVGAFSPQQGPVTAVRPCALIHIIGA